MSDNQDEFDPLDDLARKAASFDAEAAAAGASGAPGEPPQQTLSNAQCIQGAIAAAREAFCFITKLESPKRIVTDARAQDLAGLWGPVADKYGMEFGKYLGDYVLEIAALIGTLTILAELRTAVAAEMAERKKAEPVSPDEPESGAMVENDGPDQE